MSANILVCVYLESTAPNPVTEQKTHSKNLSVGSFLLEKVGWLGIA